MRVSLGIEGLSDRFDMLNQVSLNLLTGPVGVGKTVFAMQFLSNGAKKGEKTLYISLDEPATEIKEDFSELNIYIDDIFIFDAVPSSKRKEIRPYREVTHISNAEKIRDVTSFKKSPEIDVLALRATLKDILERNSYDRIVIDSLTSLRLFYMRGIDPDEGVHAFVQFIQSVTNSSVLFIGEDFFDLSYIEKYMDTVFRLKIYDEKITLYIEKYDSFLKENEIPLTFTNSGFAVEKKKKFKKEDRLKK